MRRCCRPVAGSPVCKSVPSPAGRCDPPGCGFFGLGGMCRRLLASLSSDRGSFPPTDPQTPCGRILSPRMRVCDRLQFVQSPGDRAVPSCRGGNDGWPLWSGRVIVSSHSKPWKSCHFPGASQCCGTWWRVPLGTATARRSCCLPEPGMGIAAGGSVTGRATPVKWKRHDRATGLS